MNPIAEQAVRAQSASPVGSASTAEVAFRRLQLIPLSDPRANARTWARALNVLTAVIGLVIAAPLMLIIALLVKLTSPGPIIYSQTRVGLDRRRGPTWGGNHRRKIDYGGRLFRIYKFRTMHASPNSELQVWADPSDKRVTRIGKFLRNYRLDELPQLFNVIKGDMNVVGPRPEQPRIFQDLHHQIQGYAQRQRVLPGITGWAQIHQHYDRSIEDVKRKLAFDLEYIERQDPLTDLHILARTIPVILLKRGAW